MPNEAYYKKIDTIALIALDVESICKLCEAECAKQWEHTAECHARFEALGALINENRAKALENES